MATIRPFNGIRFNAAEISKLICPPYDVISPEEKASLNKLAANNMVKLELPDAAGSRNKYANAKVLLDEWREKGTLITDADPSFYVYEQSFMDKGKKRSRRGFFAALKLENPQKGAIKPHEKTLSGPKADRLRLFKAVKANTSPIFGLYNDTAKTSVKLIQKIARTKPVSVAKDKDGVTHKVWKLSDPKQTGVLVNLMKKNDIFIADGHHRYETGWNYSQEMKKKDKKWSADKNYNYILSFLCPIEDPGLVVWPTHRVVEAPSDFEEKIQRYFNVMPASAFKKLAGKTPQPLLVYRDGTTRTLVIKNAKELQKAMPGKVKAYQELAVSILHSILLSCVSPDKITYVKKDDEALKLAKASKRLAVIVPSTPIKSIKEIALGGQTMPQKSTYFYPKVATGIVIHTLK
jgi:uncharacterized protein (DUF1015 family)